MSRQFEEAYYRYYGWPCYWQGDGLWGMNSLPISKLSAKPRPNRHAVAIDPQPKHVGALLRSTREVKGCHLQASNGIIGHVSDFMMDAQSWAIRQLVIKTGHQVSGREVQIPTKKVDRISYDGVREFDR